ncbi:hypothetical protein [Halovivax limisalsi]|uniref:hypothetical protein n=1 Tax=Halovivax limisalsi TaxID=1453760 RepID=UPI001FFC8A2E|nr:hypothetical protein [Halovivax limisalsi]
MNELSATFGNWKDRLTFIVAEAQFLVAGLLVSTAIAIVWLRPSLPGVPPIVLGWVAALMLLGPPVFGFFIWLVRKLRVRNMVAVHHINGVSDTREKYYVEPELWESAKIDGPSPYPVNDGRAFEVREFDYQDDIDQLTVRGCYMSQLADSKLVSTKAMLEDIHGDLIETWLAYNRLRARISKMGLQIQGDVVNQEAEADERGLMNPRTTVKRRFEAAESDARENATDDIQDVTEFVEDYAAEHGIKTTDGPPATTEQAATDGGEQR